MPAIKNYSSRAERLATCLDVYNAGRSGLSPVSYPVIFDRLVNSYTPNVAVIAIGSGDRRDMSTGFYTLERDPISREITKLKPKLMGLSAQRLRLDPILSRSALATFLMYRLKALLALDLPRTEKKIVPTSEPTERKRVTELLVHVFRDINKRTPLVVLYLDRIDYGANSKAVIDTSKASFQEFKQIITNAANEVEIPFIATGDYLIKQYAKHGQPGHGFSNKKPRSGHLNDLGHQATAQALVDLLTSQGIQCTASQ